MRGIKKTISLNTHKNVAPDLYVEHYGHELCEPNKLPVDSSLPLYRLHYIKKGGVNLFVNNQEVLLRCNEMFILIPSSNISYSVLPHLETELYWVAYSGYAAKEITNSIGLNSQKPYVNLKSRLKTNIFTENFKVSEEDELIKNIIFQKNLLQLLLLISSATASPKLESQTQNLHAYNPYIGQALNIINENLCDHSISIKIIASQLHIHPNYLSQIFKTTIGMSFTKYITLRRIDYAVILMERGYTRINEIANMVGFIDPYFFSKTFKKVCQESPSQTIKRVQQEKSLQSFSQK